ncbi:MAG: FprA family A-type flavoprotein [Desulfobacteraceae bacterium]|nr:MAG: FprA family A-type flavoprotein [Desulfobacteraceae bacterium]
MKKVLIAYTSRAGNTEKMADYLAEGIRMAGHEATTVKLSKVESEKDLNGYDGYIFGCPTYHKDMTGGMKQFLFKAKSAELDGKAAGAFGSHTHSGEAAPMIFDTMEHVFKMNVVTLGPLNLTESMVASDECMKACHQYAKAVAEKL